MIGWCRRLLFRCALRIKLFLENIFVNVPQFVEPHVLINGFLIDIRLKKVVDLAFELLARLPLVVYNILKELVRVFCKSLQPEVVNELLLSPPKLFESLDILGVCHILDLLGELLKLLDISSRIFGHSLLTQASVIITRLVRHTLLFWLSMPFKNKNISILISTGIN